MSDESATGSFRHDRWHIDQPADDPRSTQFASAHQSHHKQLQDSTSFGALARAYHDLAQSTGMTHLGELADTLTATSRTVHESFATWLPAAALSWTRAELIARYPAYVPFHDLMSELVAGIPSPYVAFHAAHAAARACLQTQVIESALDSGLLAFSLATYATGICPTNGSASCAVAVPTGRPRSTSSLVGPPSRTGWEPGWPCC